MTRGYNTRLDVGVVDYTILDDDRVLVTYSNKVSEILGIYHYNDREHTILCDDMDTILEGVEL